MPHRLLPTHLAGRPPSYLVLGGLVLTVLSVPYLEQTFGPHWPREAPVHLSIAAQEEAKSVDQEVVVVAHFEEVPSLQVCVLATLCVVLAC